MDYYKAIPLYPQAKEMYIQGKSLNQIGKELELNSDIMKKVSKLMKMDGVEIRVNGKKYNVNETYFDNIDTEEKAYWLGFLYADGWVTNMSKYELGLALADKDKEHVEKFRDLICPDLPYRSYMSKIPTLNKEYKSVKIQITNKKLVETLISKGCVPNKSLIVKFPDTNILPEHLQRHFIRGYFDGNGSVSYYLVNSKYKRGDFNITTIESFLNSIQDIFYKNIKGYNKVQLSNKKDTEVKSLSKSGIVNLQSIFKYLYTDATIYLKRKYDKFIEIFNNFNITSMPSINNTVEVNGE